MKTRTLARPLVLVVAALALLAVLPVSAQSAETITLRLADFMPTTHYFVHKASVPWMDRVVQLSKTKVVFQHFPAEQLGKHSDQVNILKTGVADVSYCAPGGRQSDFPVHTFFTLPGIFENSIESSRFLQQMLKEGPMTEEYRKFGFRVLLTWVMPSYEVLTVKKPVQKLEDFKGMKMRTSGAAISNVMRALGAVSVEISTPDMLMAMQRGVVDGTTNAYLSAKGYRLDEICKYATVGAALSSSVPAWAILETTWQKLPADVREAMTRANEEIAASVLNYEQEETNRIIADFEKGGMKIYRLPADEKARWNQALAPLMDKWAKDIDAKGLPGTRVLDSYKKVRGR